MTLSKDNRVAFVLLLFIVSVLGFGGWLLLGSKEAVTEYTHDLGEFYMPADFEAQSLLFLAGEDLAISLPGLMQSIVKEVVGEVPVKILTGSSAGSQTVELLLADFPPTEIVQLREGSMWLRDFGPLTVTDQAGKRSFVNFNSGLRRCLKSDNSAVSVLSVQLDLAILSNHLWVEGGDVLTNGRGLGVLSERVLLANEDFRDKKPKDIVQTVASLLGFENVIVLPPLQGEPAGHVDMYCAFLATNLVVVGEGDPKDDRENADLLNQIARDLKGQSTFDGPLRVERLPQPGHSDGVWRSYTKLVFANDVVLVPVYPDYCPESDAEALAFYRRLLPERRIVGVDASGLAELGGNLRDIMVPVALGAPFN